MTTNDEEFRALDDVPADADKLVGDEVEPEHDLVIDPVRPDIEDGELDG